jgi:FK506-binding protein 4/5
LLTYYFFGKKEKTPSEMSNSEKIEAATRKKEEGNLLFKTGKYQQAGKKYDKVTRYVPVYI